MWLLLVAPSYSHLNLKMSFWFPGTSELNFALDCTDYYILTIYALSCFFKLFEKSFAKCIYRKNIKKYLKYKEERFKTRKNSSQSRKSNSGAYKGNYANLKSHHRWYSWTTDFAMSFLAIRQKGTIFSKKAKLFIVLNSKVKLTLEISYTFGKYLTSCLV